MTVPTVLTTHPMNTSFSYNVIHTRAIREKPGGFKYSYAMYLVYQLRVLRILSLRIQSVVLKIHDYFLFINLS